AGHRVSARPWCARLGWPTPAGAAELEQRARPAPPPPTLVDDLLDPHGLRRAHARLLAEHRVRYLDCEGGHTVLAALRGAGVLDEVFLTVTPFVVDASA